MHATAKDVKQPFFVTARYPLLLLVIWLGMAAAVNPVGEFPLNDDALYARVVQALVEEGVLIPSDWQAMTLVAQAVWGALFCLLTGFSFTALRISTLVLGLVGVWAAYGMLKEVGCSSRRAFAGALMLAVNPLYFVLSYTFMTDVPCLAIMLLTGLFLMRALRCGSPGTLAFGTLFAIIAVLIRQTSLIIPLAFLPAYVLSRRLSLKSCLAALVPAAGAVVSLKCYNVWLSMINQDPYAYVKGVQPVSIFMLFVLKSFGDSVERLVMRFGMSFTYAGLLLLPLAVPAALSVWRDMSRASRRFSLAGVLLVLASFVGLLIRDGRLMPLSGNVLYNFGLGPQLLVDVYRFDMFRAPALPLWCWFVVTFMGVLGAGSLLLLLAACAWRLAALLFARAEETVRGWGLMLLTAVCGYVVYLMFAPYYFDRYILPLFALLLPLLALRLYGPVPMRRAGVWATAAFLALLGLFSTAATHDYLEWNRARWRAIRFLVDEVGADPCDVNGGIEYGGWQEGQGAGDGCSGDREHIVAFGSVPGHATLKSFAYRSYLRGGRGEIQALKKIPAGEGG
ncbi:glycosyltransferase family 39 protein [Thermodesulfobacteriota bacterium]